MEATTIRLLICDDHELVRRGLTSIFAVDPDIEVVGEAGTADEAVTLAHRLLPDVVVMDVRMPGRSGIEACRDIRSAHEDIHVLMLTSFADDEALFSAILAGASGYILKRVHGDDLLNAIHRVYRGESLLDPAVSARVMARIRGDAASGKDPMQTELTPREQTIVALVGEGLTNRQIGEKVHLAEKTVKNYVSTILMKLGVSRRTEIAALVANKHRANDDSEWSS